eukprot:CAMPEP_0201129598 /NCGR_PEP_ID=MMETSP0850-20130426/37518_1 /ASSEMBLY_ACC=CAM_ASM_000622 /TAXON_ID=183588 /ORGANISM="Pseudo-nitzschia fraudulenta, Strain WWA7" /LENGTH=299 /DNA_ID=CAMNT_0047399125 /DNA_START=87 /DNA_END=986 /DNA_ORIENTATION=-
MPCSNLNVDTTIDDDSILQAMLEQEERYYRINDYFQNKPRAGEFPPVDADARLKIAEWCMNIGDAYTYSNELTAVAMSCLDRFASTEDGTEILLDRSRYQLAALTSMYVSAKIHCPIALSIELIEEISQYAYSKEDIEAMERRILDAIEWRINPPTAMDFVRIYLDSSIASNYVFDQSTHNMLMEVVGCQINLSLLRFDVATTQSSRIAIASLLNAVDHIFTNDWELYEGILEFASMYSDINPDCLESLQRVLYRAIPAETNVEAKKQENSTCEVPSEEGSHPLSAPGSPRLVYDCFVV